MQLEGQARASVRAIAAKLRELDRLQDWVAAASLRLTTPRRIDANHNQVRRPFVGTIIPWPLFMPGARASRGQEKVKQLIGGPGHSLYPEHLVKDEVTLSQRLKRTQAFFLMAPGCRLFDGNFDV